MQRVSFLDDVKVVPVVPYSDKSESKYPLQEHKEPVKAELVKIKIDSTIKSKEFIINPIKTWTEYFFKLTLKTIEDEEFDFAKILLGPVLNYLNQEIIRLQRILQEEQIKQNANHDMYHLVTDYIVKKWIHEHALSVKQAGREEIYKELTQLLNKKIKTLIKQHQRKKLIIAFSSNENSIPVDEKNTEKYVASFMDTYGQYLEKTKDRLLNESILRKFLNIEPKDFEFLNKAQGGNIEELFTRWKSLENIYTTKSKKFFDDLHGNIDKLNSERQLTIEKYKIISREWITINSKIIDIYQDKFPILKNEKWLDLICDTRIHKKPSCTSLFNVADEKGRTLLDCTFIKLYVDSQDSSWSIAKYNTFIKTLYGHGCRIFWGKHLSLNPFNFDIQVSDINLKWKLALNLEFISILIMELQSIFCITRLQKEVRNETLKFLEEHISDFNEDLWIDYFAIRDGKKECLLQQMHNIYDLIKSLNISLVNFSNYKLADDIRCTIICSESNNPILFNKLKQFTVQYKDQVYSDVEEYYSSRTLLEKIGFFKAGVNESLIPKPEKPYREHRMPGF